MWMCQIQTNKPVFESWEVRCLLQKMRGDRMDANIRVRLLNDQWRQRLGMRHLKRLDHTISVLMWKEFFYVTNLVSDRWSGGNWTLKRKLYRIFLGKTGTFTLYSTFLSFRWWRYILVSQTPINVVVLQYILTAWWWTTKHVLFWHLPQW